MTTLLLLALTVRQAPVTADIPKPSALIGAMLSRYAVAPRLSGNVTFHQVGTAEKGKAEVTVTTEFALERPARLRISQKSSKFSQKPFIVTSDGTDLTYDVPDLEAPPGYRLAQPVAELEGGPDVSKLIALGRRSLPDPFSPFLAVAGAGNVDLVNFKSEWVTLGDGGAGAVNGVACRIVKGKWRQAATQNAVGTYGMWLTPQGDLLKYSTEQSFDAMDDDGKPLGKVTLLSEWTGTIAVNPALPDGAFKVVR